MEKTRRGLSWIFKKMKDFKKWLMGLFRHDMTLSLSNKLK